MHTGVLSKLFGNQKQWHGSCIVVVDAEAAIQSSGTDAIVNAGVKMFAPRLISGRLEADAICYLHEETALVVVQQSRIRQAGVEDQFQQTVLIVDTAHVAAIEFAHAKPLAAMGLSEPPRPTAGSGKLRG
jgi:hypothetical protein